MDVSKSTRHAKITGDFGEAAVLYYLSLSGFECARVDHTGIDLIARSARLPNPFGISVKARSRSPGTEHGQASGARLPESDREDMEIFLERIHQLMPVLGVDALLPVAAVPDGATANAVLVCAIKGLKATGRPTPAGFVVFKGSQAVLKERASSHQYPYSLVTRNRLIKDGTLAATNGHLVFTRDTEFSSPSAAATVLHGGPANGLTAWRNRQGKSLKELEAD